MPELPVVSGQATVRALERAGFRVRRQRGSHTILSGPGGATVSVPVHGGRDVKPGTLRGIIRDAGMTVDEFASLLK